MIMLIAVHSSFEFGEALVKAQATAEEQYKQLIAQRYVLFTQQIIHTFEKNVYNVYISQTFIIG